MSRKEHRHCCVFDMENKTLKVIDYSDYEIDYFPLKLCDDKILNILSNEVHLFNLNNDN